MHMSSVSRVSVGTELRCPPMCLIVSKLHNIVSPFPSKCFVIKPAGLIVPRIFWVLRSLFLLFLLQPEVLCFHVLDGATPSAERQPSYCCSICPDSRVGLVSQLTYRVGQSIGLARTADHATVFRFGAAQRHHLPCQRPRRQRVSPNTQAVSRCRASCLRASSGVSVRVSIGRHGALLAL